MEMKYLKAIDIPANKPVSLNPTGLHVWLTGLKQPLVAGQTISLTLTFEKVGQRKITVPIIKPGAPRRWLGCECRRRTGRDETAVWTIIIVRTRLQGTLSSRDKDAARVQDQAKKPV